MAILKVLVDPVQLFKTVEIHKLESVWMHYIRQFKYLTHTKKLLSNTRPKKTFKIDSINGRAGETNVNTFNFHNIVHYEKFVSSKLQCWFHLKKGKMLLFTQGVSWSPILMFARLKMKSGSLANDIGIRGNNRRGTNVSTCESDF